MATLTVTAKGQITLKQELLRHLNVSPGQKIEVEKLPNGRLMVKPVKRTGSIDAFIGSLKQKGGPHFTIDEINEAIAAGWAGEK